MKYTRQQEDAIGLLTKLLALPSVNGRDDESRMALLLRDYFEAHQISAAVQEIDGLHANVFAFIPGDDAGETMIWNGHLDTVPYGDPAAWSSDPAVPAVREGRIYGRGASDMKSGLAAMVYALCEMQEKGIRPFCNILFIGTCDEEKGGLGAEAAAKVLHRFLTGEVPAGFPEGISVGVPPASSGCGPKRPFLLVGEPTALRPGTAQKGCLWLQLQVKGRTSHGAYPEQGINAVSCGMRIAQAIASYVTSFTHPLLGGATAQVTMIEGGVAPNMTPDACTIVMDIRMVPGLAAEQVLRRAAAALEEERTKKPGLAVEFVQLNSRRAIEIASGHAMTEKLGRLIRESGGDDAPIGINFFTDASIMDREDEMDICLFGPGDPALAHQPDEYVETGRYLEAILLLERFASGVQESPF